MSFWRRLFDNATARGNEGSGHHGRGARGHHRRYEPSEWFYQDEPWGRRAGTIPASPPDVPCPNCRKSNPPGTLLCKQCETPLDPLRCSRCGAAVNEEARFCPSCGLARQGRQAR
jgi:hypothetical protein